MKTSCLTQELLMHSSRILAICWRQQALVWQRTATVRHPDQSAAPSGWTDLVFLVKSCPLPERHFPRHLVAPFLATRAIPQEHLDHVLP